MKKMELYDVKSGKLTARQIKYKYAQNITYRQYPIYETSCSTITNQNGTKENICDNVLKEYNSEEVIDWVEIDTVNGELPSGKTRIGGFAEVLVGDTIEWIPTLFGVKVPEWAQWSSSLNTNIEAYWKFDVDNGTVTPDNATYKHNMTFQGGTDTTAAAAKLGAAGANFDGVDDYANFGVVVALGTNNFTIAGWMRPQGLGSYRILASSTGAFRFSTALSGANDKPAYWIGEGGSWNIANAVSGSASAVSNNTWVHVAFVRNATNFTMYVNGTPQSETILPAGFSFANGFQLLGNDDAGSFMKGHIDELGVWYRPLTPAEITALYNDFTGITWTDNFEPFLVTLNSPPTR